MSDHPATRLVSVDMPGAAAATGLSESTIRNAIADGSLTAHYKGKKPVVRIPDLDDWIESLPVERERDDQRRSA